MRVCLENWVYDNPSWWINFIIDFNTRHGAGALNYGPLPGHPEVSILCSKEFPFDCDYLKFERDEDFTAFKLKWL